jgi:hypothetical protein
MKNSVKVIIGIAILIFITGTVVVCAHYRHLHRGMRGMMAVNRMNRHGREMDFRQMRGPGPGRMGHMGQMMGRPQMNGMRGGMNMGPGQMGHRGQMMGQQPMNGMRRGMGMGPGMNRMGRGMGPMGMNQMGQGQMGPRRMIESIPNLTDKQKKEIADLRQNQQNEMKKLREETLLKAKTLRESHRSKVMNLLTDEQKKFVESGSGKTNPAPVKVK